MQRFINNWETALTAPATLGATELSVPAEQAAHLVGLGSGDYYELTLVEVAEGAEAAWEIVKVTGAVGGVLTVEREQDGTEARLWVAGTKIAARLTAGALTDMQAGTGAQGPAGPQGPEGPEGPAGPQGPAGAQGAQGLQGPAGEPGETGAQGPAGPVGAQGETGPQGETGAGLRILGSFESSAELPAGAAVGDAYLVQGDLWVWTGTEWDNTGPIQGPAGPAGPQGETGPQGEAGPQGEPGPAGPQGAQGAQGIQGDVGPQGPAGAAGSPRPAIVTFSGNLTAGLANENKYNISQDATAQQVTIPLQSSVAWPDDAELHFERGGAGALSFVGASGVTINRISTSTNAVAGQYGVVTLKRKGMNVWTLFGALGVA